jgi:hypothetical protein
VKAASRLLKRVVPLERLVSGAIDCVLEARNNAERGEWAFAETNLRTLFRNATAIAKRRTATLHLLRLARKEEKR